MFLELKRLFSKTRIVVKRLSFYIGYTNIIIGVVVVEVCSQARKWGRSVGVVIPKEAAKKAHIKPGDEIRLIITCKQSPVSETFGILKMKRPTAELLREVDRESWDE